MATQVESDGDGEEQENKFEGLRGEGEEQRKRSFDDRFQAGTANLYRLPAPSFLLT
jgi:hypothetical protein